MSAKRRTDADREQDLVVEALFKDHSEVAEAEALEFASREFAKIAAKRPEVRTVPMLKLVLWAFRWGWVLSERTYRKQFFAGRLQTGGRVRLGGLKGAAVEHGDDLGHGRQAAWRARHRELLREDPLRKHMSLTDQIGEESDPPVSGRTVRKYVPNPSATRRGRRNP